MESKAKPAANRGCYGQKNHAGEQQVRNRRTLMEKGTGSTGEVTERN